MTAPWVREMVERVVGTSRLEVGKVLKHPDGYKVKIIEGRYWGDHGLSNFWYWRRVSKGGRLGKTECGYGW